MNLPVFLDTNVPIYASGGPHPLRAPARRIIDLVAAYPESFVTDVEVFQELLHRNLALRTWDTGRAVFEQLFVLFEGRIAAVEPPDVALAARLADGRPGITARDLLHIAIMRHIGASHVVSEDADFDRLGVERLAVSALTTWEDELVGQSRSGPPHNR